MKETSLSVRLEEPTLTGDEFQRMTVGILIHQGILESGQWPTWNVHVDLIPNAEDPCLPKFVIRMCESAEDEAEVERLEALVGNNDYGFPKGSVKHFSLMRKK